MLVAVGVIALAVLASAVALWPRGELRQPTAGGQADSTRLVSATLTSVARNPCPEADPGVPGSVCIKVKARPTKDGDHYEVEIRDSDTYRWEVETAEDGQAIRWPAIPVDEYRGVPDECLRLFQVDRIGHPA